MCFTRLINSRFRPFAQGRTAGLPKYPQVRFTSAGARSRAKDASTKPLGKAEQLINLLESEVLAEKRMLEIDDPSAPEPKLVDGALGRLDSAIEEAQLRAISQTQARKEIEELKP